VPAELEIATENAAAREQELHQLSVYAMAVERDLRQSLAVATDTLLQVEKQKASLEAQTIDALQSMRNQLDAESKAHVEAETLLLETVGALQQQLAKSVQDMEDIQTDCENRIVAIV
jgi:type VI protein secretion system component VasA